MLVILYVKNDHVKYISDVATDSAGTGLMGMMVCATAIHEPIRMLLTQKGPYRATRAAWPSGYGFTTHPLFL